MSHGKGVHREIFARIVRVIHLMAGIQAETRPPGEGVGPQPRDREGASILTGPGRLPRFHLAAVMVLILAFAFGFAALKGASRPWAIATMLLGMGITLAAHVIAARGIVLGLGFVAAFWAYILATVVLMLLEATTGVRLNPVNRLVAASVPILHPIDELGPSDFLDQNRRFDAGAYAAIGQSLTFLAFSMLGAVTADLVSRLLIARREARRRDAPSEPSGADPTSPLILPFRKGRELLDEIRDTRPAPGTLAVWWLGQSGFLIKSEVGLLAIDPYLSEHLTAKYAATDKPHVRMTEAPFRGADLEGVDLILASHKHSDHLDPGTIPGLLAASHDAILVLPSALVEHAHAMGLPQDRVVGIDAGETSIHAGFRVRAVASAHEGLDTDGAGRHLYLGFVVEVGGLRVYHSGDGLAYDGLADAIGEGPFDAFFLPINGRDPRRGVAGNMAAAEAVDLAARCRPRFVVPRHYDMFTFNTVPVAEFENEARGLPVGVTPRVLRCGERWEIRP